MGFQNPAAELLSILVRWRKRLDRRQGTLEQRTDVLPPRRILCAPLSIKSWYPHLSGEHWLECCELIDIAISEYKNIIGHRHQRSLILYWNISVRPLNTVRTVIKRHCDMLGITAVIAYTQSVFPLDRSYPAPLLGKNNWNPVNF